jgi:hypothetical protein
MFSAENHAVFYITVGCVLIYTALGGLCQVVLQMSANVVPEYGCLCYRHTHTHTHTNLNRFSNTHYTHKYIYQSIHKHIQTQTHTHKTRTRNRRTQAGSVIRPCACLSTTSWRCKAVWSYRCTYCQRRPETEINDQLHTAATSLLGKEPRSLNSRFHTWNGRSVPHQGIELAHSLVTALTARMDVINIYIYITCTCVYLCMYVECAYVWHVFCSFQS